MAETKEKLLEQRRKALCQLTSVFFTVLREGEDVQLHVKTEITLLKNN